MSNEYLDDVQKQYSDQLERAALGYLEAGIKIFLSERQSQTYAGIQAAIGNMAVSVELMLKAFIARKSLLLVFKNLPVELRVLITNPETIHTNINWRSFEIELKSSSYSTIELEECISLFYIFFPEQKTTLHSHLKYLSRSRNASVHSTLPTFQIENEANRITYIVLKVCDALNAELPMIGNVKRYFPESEIFLSEFREEMVEKVQKAIEDAKQKAKKLPHKSNTPRYVSIDYWKQEVMNCPVCGHLAILSGTTERVVWTRRGDEEIQEPGLWFEPENFFCSECGLSLDGIEEIKLAGIDINSSTFDRTEDIDDCGFYENQTRTYFEKHLT